MIHDACAHPWRHAVRPFRIVGNLYYVGNADVSSHLIDTGEGLILLDTTYPQTVYLLLESVRRLGFDPDDIRYLIHCHGHYDHVGGTRALVELTHARTCLGRPDITMVTERLELSWAPEYGVRFHETFAVDEPLEDGSWIALGNTTLEAVAAPGHTPGSMAFFFPVSDGAQSWVAGIHGGPGLNTLSRDYLDRYGLELKRREDYLESLERLRERKVDIHLGAHPSQNDTLEKLAAMHPGGNPFVDPTAWPRYLDGLEQGARNAFSTD